MSFPPRILLVMPDQWPRALLRAALREVGYDASGTRSVPLALTQAAAVTGRGPVRLVLLDQDALTKAESGQLERLRNISDAAIVLLAPATRRVPEGPWTRVIRRPMSIGSLVHEVEAIVPLPSGARRPVD